MPASQALEDVLPSRREAGEARAILLYFDYYAAARC